MIIKKYILLLTLLVIFSSCKGENYKYLTGNAFGTTFNIKYQDHSKRELVSAIDSIFKSVNKSLSTYDKTSDISRINAGEKNVIVDKKFIEVFNKSRRIFDETNGVFDPTIGVLVNAWNFGPQKTIKKLDSAKVRNLMRFVGFDKVHLQNNKVIKEYKEIYFDFNAIAKGYGLDVIARYFNTIGLENYMIEIGGEVRVKGKNPANLDWNIEISKPNFNGEKIGFKTVRLQNESMATSGTYRHFKVDKNGQKYAHIIDTKTGFPVKSNVLSVTVIAKLDCADVDGYATTLLAMGLEQSKKFLKNHPELTVFIIYSAKDGSLETYQTDSF